MAQGGTPIVSVYYPPQTTFDQTAVGPVVRELYGALIDTLGKLFKRFIECAEKNLGRCNITDL